MTKAARPLRPSAPRVGPPHAVTASLEEAQRGGDGNESQASTGMNPTRQFLLTRADARNKYGPASWYVARGAAIRFI